MVLSNSFTCPNSHKFQANAKLRARCPECGAMARKAFGSKEESKPKEVEEPKVEPTADVKPKEEVTPPPEPTKKVRVLRQGKRPEIKMVKPKVEARTSIVKHKKISRKIIPSIRAKPKGNREHKVARSIGEAEKTYEEKVRHEYWFR